MKLTKEQKKEILFLHKKGKSSREIAQIILGRKSRKTTVTDYLKDKKTNLISIPKAKILILDIETSPCLAYYWKRWKENISEVQAVSESFILTYSAKWFGDSEILFDYLSVDETDREDDSRLLGNLHKLLSSADIVVAHNALNFDIPIIQTRLLSNGFTEPLPYKVIDTLKIAKRYFRFPSNSLLSLAKYLNLTNKTSPVGGFQLWRDYLSGIPEAVQNMVEYNMNDVVVLEELYLKIRAWDKLHPNVALYTKGEVMVCPTCGADHTHISTTGKFAYTTVSAFPVYICDACGKNFRGRKSNNNKTNLGLNIQL